MHEGTVHRHIYIHAHTLFNLYKLHTHAVLKCGTSGYKYNADQIGKYYYNVHISYGRWSHITLVTEVMECGPVLLPQKLNPYVSTKVFGTWPHTVSYGMWTSSYGMWTSTTAAEAQPIHVDQSLWNMTSYCQLWNVDQQLWNADLQAYGYRMWAHIHGMWTSGYGMWTSNYET